MTNEDYQKIFHEIKNNIAFISSSLQLLEKTHPGLQSYPYWNDAMQEIRDLKNLLLDLSSARLCSCPTLVKISPETYFPELVRSCTSFFDAREFQCSLALSPGLPDISIDPQRFKRAFFNLLKNSYEAMQGRGAIQIEAMREDAFLRVDLIDCGGGILPEYLPKLFVPFETTKQEGTGLGLLIARQIIEAHGGHIRVDSRPQDGCTFSIYLPLS